MILNPFLPEHSRSFLVDQLNSSIGRLERVGSNHMEVRFAYIGVGLEKASQMKKFINIESQSEHMNKCAVVETFRLILDAVKIIFREQILCYFKLFRDCKHMKLRSIIFSKS